MKYWVVPPGGPNPGLHQKSQTRSQTVVSHDLKFPTSLTSNQHLDTRLDVGLTSIRRLRFQTRVVQSAVSVPSWFIVLWSVIGRYWNQNVCISNLIMNLNYFLMSRDCTIFLGVFHFHRIYITAWEFDSLYISMRGRTMEVTKTSSTSSTCWILKNKTCSENIMYYYVRYCSGLDHGQPLLVRLQSQSDLDVEVRRTLSEDHREEPGRTSWDSSGSDEEVGHSANKENLGYFL